MTWLIETIKDNFGLGLTDIKEPELHLKEAIRWLCRAQDAGQDDGVSRMYHLKTGWGASYPETTGYIIPTFIDYYQITGEQEYLDRALLMADWESSIQMHDGAVQGGTIADKASPAIFNTGQVIFGWSSAYKQSNKKAYIESLTNAANYLVKYQDHDGAWRKNLSAFCSSPSDSYTYNIRTAWSLWIAYEITGNDIYKAHAEQNLKYVMSVTNNNGWSEKNCLNDPDSPLLHTIAYTFQGMLELGVLSNSDEAIQKTITGNEYLLYNLKKNGSLGGRYNNEWQQVANWRCLTGEAQTSIIWFRLAQITGDQKWRDAALELNSQIKQTQKIIGAEEVRGGIKGSYPVNGWYGKYELLNWAAKFFADAVMLELNYTSASQSG